MSQAAKFSLGLLVMQFLLSVGGDAIAADSVKLGVVSTSQVRNDLFISKAQITKEPKWNPDAGVAPPVALQDVATKARVLLSSLGATDAKYSDTLDTSGYYDGVHVWDDAQKVKKLKLRKVKGYIFDQEGDLSQEFESLFNQKTGIYESGSARFADGTERKD